MLFEGVHHNGTPVELKKLLRNVAANPDSLSCGEHNGYRGCGGHRELSSAVTVSRIPCSRSCMCGHEKSRIC